MANASDDGRAVVAQRVLELVEALRVTPAIERFRAADERFRGDAELTQLQAGLRLTHQQLQQAEREGRHDGRLFREVRESQARLQQHPLVVEFVAARKAAQDILRETNQEMTGVLGLDVGASAGRSGGCC